MMSSENIPPPSQPPDHNHSAGSRKPSAAQEPPQPLHPLKCPRCDSSNTKFCYYNNYSLTQPRHFCKTCRRYWTKGGALRNVPIGGGCRKSKKLKPSPSSYPAPSPSSSSAAEFRFLTPPPAAAALEFQLGGLSLPRLHPATAGVYTHFIASSGAHHPQPPLGAGPSTGGCFSLDLLGLGNYPPVPNSGNSSSTNSSLSLAGGGAGGGDHTLTISSIESLSTINQEMHWKLQQQRLALIYGPSSGIEQDDNNNQQEKTTSVGGGGGIHLFKNLETTKKLDGVGGPTPAHAPTEWLFDQIQANSSSANNYGVSDTNNNNTSVVGVNTCTTTNCNNNNNNSYEDFNGVWTTELHHHHQFNGLQ